VTLQNQEVERLRGGLGAVCLLNAPQPIDPTMTAQWPMDVEFCRQARRAGGFVDAEKPIWKNVPVNAAFGLLDSVGVVPNHFHPHDVALWPDFFASMECDNPHRNTPAGFAAWVLDLYYRFLNSGFPLPAVGGIGFRNYVELAGL
jgi:hypothetical protein